MKTPERPARIQRKRMKEWKKPTGAICVDRPSVWGNPFSIEEYGLSLCLQLYRAMFYGWNPTLLKHLTDEEYRLAYQRQRNWKIRLGGNPLDMAQLELRGHDLVAWCPLDQPCHVDILLELANL